MNYTELTVVELRGRLKERGLKVGGTKAELVERLEEAKEPVVVEVAEKGVPEVPYTEKEISEMQEEVEEAPKTEMDIMPSETPTEAPADPHADARIHLIGQGSVSGEWIFDNVPGSIAAHTLEEAFEKYRTTPGVYKVPGSH